MLAYPSQHRVDAEDRFALADDAESRARSAASSSRVALGAADRACEAHFFTTCSDFRLAIRLGDVSNALLEKPRPRCRRVPCAVRMNTGNSVGR